MDFAFLSQADHVTLQLELARAALEVARAHFETAKAAHEELLAQAESRGIPRAKLKKLAEDRVQGLLEAGLVERASTELLPRKERAPRKAKNLDSSEDFSSVSIPASTEIHTQ
jgi:hypothetical protein